MQQTRLQGLTSVYRVGKNAKLPANFITTFLQALKVPLLKEEPPFATGEEALEKAIQAQHSIDFYHMAVGLFATEWTNALQ